MQSRSFLAAAYAALFFICLSSCQRNAVSLQTTNATGEVPQLGNLYFRFSKSLYPDSLLNRWDSSGYISFSPKIAGRFRWNGPDELIFSPSDPLLPATTYKAEINKEVLKFSKYNDLKSEDIRFNTAPLALSDIRANWIIQQDDNRKPVPQIQLYFNYPVNTEEVKDKLSISIDGNKTGFSLQNTGVNQIVNVRLPGFKGEDKDYETLITLAPGMVPAKGMNKTKEPIQSTLTLPSPYHLVIHNVESEHDGTQGIVRLYTSQQVAGNAAKYISFDPKVNISVQPEENMIIIRSDKFDASRSYTFTVSQGLRGMIGGELKEPYQGSVAFGQLESDIRFLNSKAVYLSKQGAGNIEVRITNTPKVRLVISKIYENNLLMAERFGYIPQDNVSENTDEEYYESDNAMAGDVIFSKEIETRTLPRSGNGRILNIAQFEDQLPDVKGIYHILIRSSSDYWVRDSRFLSRTDIGLIAKQGTEKIYVFANSLKTAKQLPGVTISIYGSNNQLLGTGSTNEDGAVEIPVNGRNLSGFKPALVTAKTENDFTYLPFNTTRVNTSRFETGGKVMKGNIPDAYLYAERDIYRPGETINFAAILRDKNWKNPGEIPVKLVFLMPNGKELKSFRKSLNEQGATQGSITISNSAITGSYTLELYSANDVLLSTKNFMVEEFVPDRIKVEVNLSKPFLKPGESSVLKIAAVNFFGPPAANRNYELEIQVRQQQFKSTAFKDYNFTLANQQTFFDKVVKEGKTGADGLAEETYEVPEMYTGNGLLHARFYTTVFDETGRPVSRPVTADIFTQDVFYGIRKDDYYYYALNQPVRFDLASVNKDGNAVQSTGLVKIIKHEYRTVLTRSVGNYFRYESQKETRVISEKEMSIGAGTAFHFVPRAPGDYEIRVSKPGSPVYVSRHFYSYGSWGSDNSSFEVNNEGQIEITTDKESYRCGDNIKVLFKAPFSGRMLVTTEIDHVISYRFLDVIKKTASLELPVGNDILPNIYITATLLKPHEISDIPLTVAHGFQNIKVTDEKRKIAVSINAAKNTRSSTHQKVSVKTIPGSYVSLAAVDNGVLQVTDFKTPDPHGYFYQKRALQVNAYDMYPLLFPELRTRLSSTGGDGELEMDKRVNPMQAKRFKIMSYWSGLKKAGSNGIAEFEFDIPQFNGQIRLMAVAVKDDKFGSTDQNMTVADPIILSSALPRFISPGDTIYMPVTLSNTTRKSANGQVSLSVSGPVKISGEAVKPVSINANSEERVMFKLYGEKDIDIASIKVSITTPDGKFYDETEISVRPASPLQKISGSGSIAAGNSMTIKIPKSDFIESSFNYDVLIGHPLIEMSDQLKYLIQYPYGCTEQIVSSAFPQLYYSDIANLLGLKNKEAAGANVIEAIRKIKMRQLYNGALTLWEGQGTEHWWATTYAAHFLLEARKAGYDVENSLLEPMLTYLGNKLKSKQTIEYYYNRDQKKKIAPKEIPYSLYVFALAGRPQASTMNYYKSNPEILALDGKYLLSAAYAISGDKRSFNGFLPSSFSNEESVQETGGSFYSFLRDESIALNALLDADPGNNQIPFLAKHVSNLLKSEKYPNTQERSFTLLALGKLARNTSNNDISANLVVNGKTITSINGNWKGSNSFIRNNTFEISSKGKAILFYTWIAEGISKSGAYTEEDNYLKVRRNFFDRFGKPLKQNTFKQNELIIVEVTLEKVFNTPIQNIVITDILPAGFEIENPRTKELPGMDWIKNAAEPNALDVRDDRINFFVDAYHAKQKYYYAVRAVTPGVFKQGPVSADAMYNGEMHSYHGAQTIRVIP